MATWNVDRKKGGTYSFKLDAQGNYGLHKDGFDKVKTLNLPELKAEATKTTTTQDTKTASAQTKEAFGDVQPFYYQNRGDGQRADEQYIDEYQIKKDKSLDTDINQTYSRPNMLDVSGPVKEPVSDTVYQDAIMRGEKGIKAEAPKINEKSIRVNKQGTEFSRPKAGTIDQMAKDAMSVPGKTTVSDLQKQSQLGVTVPDRISSPLRPAIKKQTLTQTTLKNVTTGLKPLANAIGFVMNPVMGVARIVGGAVSPEQRNLNERNSSALSALGYKTRGELGSNVDSGRIAGNPANNVFAGMNAQSLTGNVFNGARSRISKREKTSKNLTGEKKERFDKKTQEFKDQLSEAQGEKNKQDIAKGPGHYGPAGRHSGDGGGNGGCFLKGTQVIMADGSTKAIDKVDLGDNVAKGGKVFAVGRFLNTELYDYKGIKVSGSHMVNEDGIWMRVRDTKYGKSLGNDLNTVYVFGSENRRILINDILFTDYFEVNEQDQLINSEKNFFNNWKSYGNTIDEHNVNTLNAS